MAQDGINLDYPKIRDVSAELTDANAQLVPQLATLRNRVNLLLEDGAVLKVSSDTIRNLYASLNTSLEQAAEGIKSFAILLNDIEARAQDFDNQITAALPEG